MGLRYGPDSYGRQQWGILHNGGNPDAATPREGRSISVCKLLSAGYEQLTQEEKEEVTDVIQTLYRQTFLLERKFDKRAGRMQYTKEYRTCTKHLEFFKAYFEVAGIILRENVHMGVIYIQGEQLWGEKLPRLATIYLLGRRVGYGIGYQVVDNLL